MNPKQVLFALAIALLLLAAGCTKMDSRGTAAVSFKYTDFEGKTVLEKSFSVQSGTNAWDAMRENIDVNFEEYAFGPFVKSIDGVAAPDGYYLALYVNGQYAEKGINGYDIIRDSAIEWKTEKIQDFSTQ